MNFHSATSIKAQNVMKITFLMSEHHSFIILETFLCKISFKISIHSQLSLIHDIIIDLSGCHLTILQKFYSVLIQ